jgi:hypothetical protein
METMTTTATRTMEDIVKEKLERKIAKGSTNAVDAITRMENEGKIANDFIAPLGVNLHLQGRSPVVTFGTNGRVKMNFNEREYGIHQHAIYQLGDKLGVPSGYLSNLTSGEQWQRDLAVKILNEHSNNTQHNRVLIRSIGNEVRGVLSENYRRLNSPDILTGFIEQATEQGAVISDGYMDDTRIFIEAIIPQVFTIETPKNGQVALFVGASLRTSDYGDGALDLRTMIYQGICLNGMVRESLMRQVHLGGRLPDDLTLSERTYRYDTRTTVSATKDITRMIFGVENIRRRFDEVQRASEQEVNIDTELANLVKGTKLLKGERDSIQRLVMRNHPDDGVSGEGTLWKLTQAITAQARELEPRRRADLQQLAGELMNRVK